jgi:hypothetical protein
MPRLRRRLGRPRQVRVVGIMGRRRRLRMAARRRRLLRVGRFGMLMMIDPTEGGKGGKMEIDTERRYGNMGGWRLAGLVAEVHQCIGCSVSGDLAGGANQSVWVRS